MPSGSVLIRLGVLDGLLPVLIAAGVSDGPRRKDSVGIMELEVIVLFSIKVGVQVKGENGISD